MYRQRSTSSPLTISSYFKTFPPAYHPYSGPLPTRLPHFPLISSLLRRPIITSSPYQPLVEKGPTDIQHKEIDISQRANAPDAKNRNIPQEDKRTTIVYE